MSKTVTVTYNGKVLTPKMPLDLDIGKEYEIEVISEEKINQELEELHKEFERWIADIGVKQPLTRQNGFEK